MKELLEKYSGTRKAIFSHFGLAMTDADYYTDVVDCSNFYWISDGEDIFYSDTAHDLFDDEADYMSWTIYGSSEVIRAFGYAMCCCRDQNDGAWHHEVQVIFDASKEVQRGDYAN